MVSLRNFRGAGVYPYERKASTRNKRIWNAAIPGVAVVPFLQHDGAPALPLVHPGDRVREGMLIGSASGGVSARVHSPIPGVVREIRTVQLAGGTASLAAVIELDGEFDQLGKVPRISKWDQLSADKLRELILEYGVVGMGGSGTPTHVKFEPRSGETLEWFVLNGVECEPYLSADHRLMVEKANELLEAVRIARKILSPRRVAIVLDRGARDAIAAIKPLLGERDAETRIITVSGRYPQGDEKQLVRTVAGREVPSGGTARDTGVVVCNVATMFALYEAIVLRKPVMERIVTVSGAAVRRPGNLKVRIGTPISDLILDCGGFVEQPARIIVGGPMMGLGVYDVSTPVTKVTRGILALTAAEIGEAPQTSCIQCGSCMRACPMGLDPTRLYKLIDHRQYSDAVGIGLMDCSECGACGYVCPAHIPLVQGLKTGKHYALDLPAKKQERM
ncbi:MAG TPA: electron transport complex subunit RsxC [Spirochaetia bacterium]|nr:electron transport complex subunit RsxC [Spirochaetia bacterium]